MASAVTFIRMGTDLGFFLEYKANTIVLLVGFVVYFAILLKLFVQTYLFKRSTDEFKGKEEIIIFHTLYVVIILVYMLGEIFFHGKVLIIICAPCAAGLFFAILVRPFKKMYKNILYVMNLLMISTVIAFRIFVEQYMANYNYNYTLDPLWIFFLVTNFIVMGVGQIFNFLVVFYDLWLSFTKRKVECIC